jgi:hypothetical protein
MTCQNALNPNHSDDVCSKTSPVCINHYSCHYENADLIRISQQIMHMHMHMCVCVCVCV